MTDGVSELRREEREQAAEAAAKAVDTKKRKRRAQYCYPDEVSKDEEDARDQFNHECRTAAFQTVKNDYIAAVELVFGEELFAVKNMGDILQPNELNQFIRCIYHDIRDERRLERKQRTAASVAAGNV